MIQIRRFKEAVTQKDIDRWEKESKQLSKNIRRIDNVKDFKVTKKMFMDWADKFDEFVFKNLVDDTKDNDEPILDRSVIWEYIMFIHNYLFDPFRSNNTNSYFYGERYDIPEYERETLGNYPIEAQEKLVNDWMEKRDFYYQKYNRLRKKAFDSLKEYWNYIQQDGLATEYYKTLPDKIAGINTEWKIREVDNPEEMREKVQYTKKAVEDAVDLMKEKKVSYLLKGIKLVVETHYNFDYAGKWDSSKQAIILVAPYKNKGIKERTRAFIHELGHKYVDVYMDREERMVWENFIFENSYTLTEQDIQKFYEYAKQAYQDLGSVRGTGNRFSTGDLYQYIDDSKMEFLYDVTLYNEFWDFGEYHLSYRDEREMVENEDYTILYDSLQSLVGKNLKLGTVSHYSSQRSGMELFPEVFSYYVMGYDVPYITRELLKATVGV